MTDSSNDDKKDEIKPIFGYSPSDQFPYQSDQSFASPYRNSPYHHHHHPSYDQYPYLYPVYYYPNCHSLDNNNDNNNNNNNITQSPLPNVPPPPPQRKVITLCRVLFVLVVILTLSVTIFLVVKIWRNYAYYPSFEVVSFVVHSFNITNSTNRLIADWEIDLSVRNSNRKVEISFEYIATTLMYKLQLLETSFSAPFNVSSKSNAAVHVDSKIPNLNQKKIGGLVVNEMARDFRKREKLYIDLRIEAKIVNKFRSTRNHETRMVDVVCEDLILNFKNSTSLPKWEGDTNNYIIVCQYTESWWDLLWPW